MKKSQLIVLIVFMMFIPLCYSSLFAEEFNKERDELIGKLDFYDRFESTIKNNAELIEKMGMEIEKYKKNQSLNDINQDEQTVSRAPAPPVSNLQFTGVMSENSQYNWEDIGTYQSSTTIDHGGAHIYLEVLEIGYGYDYAWMSGVQLTELAKYNVTNNAGTVVGFVHYYDASGFQNGNATTQARSMNYPYNTCSDALNIQ